MGRKKSSGGSECAAPEEPRRKSARLRDKGCESKPEQEKVKPSTGKEKKPKKVEKVEEPQVETEEVPAENGDTKVEETAAADEADKKEEAEEEEEEEAAEEDKAAE